MCEELQIEGPLDAMETGQAEAYVEEQLEDFREFLDEASETLRLHDSAYEGFLEALLDEIELRRR